MLLGKFLRVVDEESLQKLVRQFELGENLVHIPKSVLVVLLLGNIEDEKQEVLHGIGVGLEVGTDHMEMSTESFLLLGNPVIAFVVEIYEWLVEF